MAVGRGGVLGGRRRRTVLLVVGAVVVAVPLALGVGVGPAWAHDQLASSSPVAGAVLAAPPGAVTLRFTRAPNPDVVRVAVTTADGGPVTGTRPRVQGSVVTQDLPPISGGTYTVSYRVVSTDGHPITGTVRFTVTPAVASSTGPPGGTPAPSTVQPAATAAAAAAAPSAGPSGDSYLFGKAEGGWWYGLMVVPIVALVGIGMLLARQPRRRRRAADPPAGSREPESGAGAGTRGVAGAGCGAESATV